MRWNAVVDAGIQALSATGQAVGGAAQYRVDKAKIDHCEKPAAALTASLCGGGAKTIEGSTRVADLAFGAVEIDHETASQERAHEAEAAKDRAERANSAAQRIEAQLDQKLGIVQEMLRSDADLMHTLITRS
jgi:hypothetical protein